LIDRKNKVLRFFSRSFDGVTGRIAVPFARIGNAVLENFFGIGVGEKIGAHQGFVDRHKVNGAENGAKIVAHTFVKLFAGFKKLNPNATWRQTFFCTVGHDAIF
jgi:hypothetical protein